MSTREIPAKKETSLGFLFLLAQAVAGMAFSTNLMYVVAIEAPLILNRRHAIGWIVGQIIVYNLWLLLLWKWGFKGFTGDDSSFAFGIFNITVWQFFAFIISWFAANEARSRQKSAQLNAELILAQQELAEKSRAEERLRISRDLHDAVGHQLVALSLQLDIASRLSESSSGAHISTARSLARQMLTEVRGAVSLLREERVSDLYAALQTLIATIPEPKIHLSTTCDITQMNTEVGRSIWRCIQEAVNNTVKHAQASNLWIDFSRRDTNLVLSIKDDGLGNEQFTEGDGLAGMRERLASIGGSLAVHNQTDKGFALEMTIPFQGAVA